MLDTSIIKKEYILPRSIGAYKLEMVQKQYKKIILFEKRKRKCTAQLVENIQRSKKTRRFINSFTLYF